MNSNGSRLLGCSMSSPIIRTKISIPPARREWVTRIRLHKYLDEGSDHRLTIVSAPAGFGKTTLLASWLDHLSQRRRGTVRVAWLSLEEDDNDPVRFFAYFIAAWQTIDLRTGQTTQPYLDAPRVPNFNHLMTLAINDLGAQPGKNILVLDDYHLINDPHVQSAIAFFVDHMPTQCHLVIATREEPRLPLSRLRSRREVLEIRLQDLRFTAEEAGAFLRRTMGLSLTAEVTRALGDRTEGWIAGLQMIALSLRGQIAQLSDGPHVLPTIEALNCGERDIIDYLAAEVLQQQPAEIRTFLRQTAILDRFNAALCDAVVQRSDSSRILSSLERANLFLIPLDDQREWHRYHRLLADLLRLEMTELQQNGLHARASRWYEAHGDTAEAIKHALAARAYEDAVRLIRRGSEEMRRYGGFHTLLGWINALPEAVVREHSDLLVHKGWIAHMRGELLTGEAYAALAVERESPDDPPMRRGMLLAFRAYLAINRGRPELGMKFAQEALNLLGDSYYGVSALCYLGQSQRLLGDRRGALEALRRATILAKETGNPGSGLEAVCHLAMLLYQQGCLREAMLVCQEATDKYLDAWGQPLPVTGWVYVTLGTLCYEANDLTSAHSLSLTGIALGQQLWGSYEVILGLLTLAKINCARGEIEAVWERLAAARQLAAKSSNQRRLRLVTAVTAELQLRLRLIHKAAATLAELPTASGKRSAHENLVYARLLSAQGQADKALELLETLECAAQQQGRLGELVSIHLLNALCQQVLGSGEAAQESLAKSVGIAASEGYRRVFIDEKALLAPLLPKVRGMAPAFVDSLLEAFRAGMDNAIPTVSAQPLVEPLTPNQLTILRLISEGLSNREVAAKLAITEGTTKWHLNQIYGKLNVASRTQAIARARELRVL